MTVEPLNRETDPDEVPGDPCPDCGSTATTCWDCRDKMNEAFEAELQRLETKLREALHVARACWKNMSPIDQKESAIWWPWLKENT